MLGPLADREFVKLVAIVLCFATALGFLELMSGAARSAALLTGAEVGIFRSRVSLPPRSPRQLVRGFC
ncbi:MAG TPA: hypothetical protein VJ778_12780 [Burkholderiales bacterium]|nr:hypothetical protein [Burkholderiales bacterium]